MSAPASKFTQRNQLETPILRLPAELRNKVYQYIFGDKVIALYVTTNRRYAKGSVRGKCQALIKSNTEPHRSARHDNMPLNGKTSFTFALLKVSRQIHSEARMLPFHLNTFGIPRSDDLKFLLSVMQLQLSEIRTMRLITNNGWPMCWSDLQSMSHFEGVQTIEILAYLQPSFREPRSLLLEDEAVEMREEALVKGIRRNMKNLVEVRFRRID
jgi:hypothetical protein